MKEQHTDVYQRVTACVIDALSKGVVIWEKPWSVNGLPKNIISGKQYRGWNVFFLAFITWMHGYRNPYFITYNQALKLGGAVRKGERGYPIVHWAEVKQKRQEKLEGEANPDPEKKNTRMVPKMHTVFNLDQTTGLDVALGSLKEVQSTAPALVRCAQLVQEMPHAPQILHGGSEAYYDRRTDTVQMPEQRTFYSGAFYFKTLFHELAHSTGHTSRLNRKELMNSAFGNELYSKEELTAELTAAFLSGICGIEAKIIKNSAAYIKGWLTALQNDKTMVLKAASQAQAAADYIQGIKVLIADDHASVGEAC